MEGVSNPWAVTAAALSGLNSVVLLLVGYVLNDLRGRIMRLENRYFSGRVYPEAED